MGHSTGLVFAHFPDKESVWRAAMGTAPPVDSPLTRAAPLMLETLEALLDRQCPASTDADAVWAEARRAVDAARGIQTHAPRAGLTDGAFPDRKLNLFGAEMIAEVKRRDAMPSFRSVMEPVFSLCELLVSQAQRREGSQADIHDAAVAACATIAQVAVQGVADVPYRPAADAPRPPEARQIPRGSGATAPQAR